MPLISKRYLNFDESDVHLMKEMLDKFHELHKGAAVPDYSNNYVSYLPVFSIALLASQEVMERLTRKLIWLTVVIAVLTLVLAALTIVLVVKSV